MILVSLIEFLMASKYAVLVKLPVVAIIPKSAMLVVCCSLLENNEKYFCQLYHSSFCIQLRYTCRTYSKIRIKRDFFIPEYHLASEPQTWLSPVSLANGKQKLSSTSLLHHYSR